MGAKFYQEAGAACTNGALHPVWTARCTHRRSFSCSDEWLRERRSPATAPQPVEAAAPVMIR